VIDITQSAMMAMGSRLPNVEKHFIFFVPLGFERMLSAGRGIAENA
jgi:hypothetical protein